MIKGTHGNRGYIVAQSSTKWVPNGTIIVRVDNYINDMRGNSGDLQVTSKRLTCGADFCNALFVVPFLRHEGAYDSSMRRGEYKTIEMRGKNCFSSTLLGLPAGQYGGSRNWRIWCRAFILLSGKNAGGLGALPDDAGSAFHTSSGRADGGQSVRFLSLDGAQ